VATVPGLAQDFRDAIACFNASRVNVVLVGGYALGWHGVVRATADIDFLYERSPENVDRLCAALRQFGAPEQLIDPQFLMSPGAVTQMGVPPLRVDLLSAITGVSFESIDRGAIEVMLDGQRLRVIGLRELRQNKGATGRIKDRQDLQRLTTARRGRRPKKAT
jgi:hypothetical protein